MSEMISVVVQYRCHQCNWRGYMFKAFKDQSRLMFWMTVSAAIIGMAVIAYIFPKILLKFVSTFANK